MSAPTAPSTNRPVTRIPMDPRIRARRVQVQRAAGRRRLRLLVRVTGAVLVVAGAVGLTRSTLLDVDRVVLVGAEHTTVDEVRAAGGLDRRVAMLDVDGHRVARSVEVLPWVQEAHVERSWPGTVRVTVTERLPVARIAVGRRQALVDASGRVLARVPAGDARAHGLPVLDTAAHAPSPGRQLPERVAPAVAVAAALPGELRGQVAVIALRGEDLDLDLRPRGRARLGPPTELEAKLVALEAVLARVDFRQITVVDLRVPDAPVLVDADGRHPAEAGNAGRRREKP